eukprot:gene10453-10612_t
MNYQGGYSCEGKIALLDCYAPDGFVTGLLYANTADQDVTAVCDFPFVGGNPVFSNNTLELDVDESIIAVEACRGAFYGYTKITVTTDKNRVWTCGGGSSKYPTRPGSYGNGCGGWSAYTRYGCYQPYDYTTKYGKNSKWGSKLTRGLLSAEDASIEGGEGRELLQEQATEDTFWLKRNWGWGWNQGTCQTYRSPRQPKWSTCGGSRCNNWYSGKSRRSGTFGYASTHFKYSGWQGPNGYYQWNSGGKNTIYYKSRSLYNKYTSYCKTSRCTYTPADYYDENYPLASFSGICDKNGALYNLYGFCWNNDYTPPPPPSALVITMTFVSDAGQPCINIAGTPPPPIDVNAVTGQIKRYIDIVAPGLLREITFYPTGYRCTPGSGATNSTTNINFGFVPGANKTVADIVAFFTAAGLGVGADVCALPPITDPVTELSFSPCVSELYTGIVAGIPGTGLTKKSKKKVSVKSVTDNLLKASQYSSYYRKYSNKKAKKSIKAYSTRYFGSAAYANAYISQFPNGYTKGMKKKYPDYKEKMQNVKKMYNASKKRGL